MLDLQKLFYKPSAGFFQLLICLWLFLVPHNYAWFTEIVLQTRCLIFFQSLGLYICLLFFLVLYNYAWFTDTILQTWCWIFFSHAFNPLTPNRRHWRRPKMSLVCRIDVSDVVRKKFFFFKLRKINYRCCTQKIWIARLEGCCVYPKMAAMF